MNSILLAIIGRLFVLALIVMNHFMTRSRIDIIHSRLEGLKKIHIVTTALLILVPLYAIAVSYIPLSGYGTNGADREPAPVADVLTVAVPPSTVADQIEEPTLIGPDIIEYREHPGIENQAVFVAARTIPRIGDISKVSGSILLTAIVLGFAVFCIRLAADTARIRRLKSGAKKRVDEETGIPIFISDSITSPFSSGIYSPCIFIPANTPRTVVGFIIMHETGHHAGGHIAARYIDLLLVHLFWFCPFTRLHLRSGNLIREMIADRCAANPKARFDYAELLIRTASSRSRVMTPMVTGMADEPGSQTALRVRALLGDTDAVSGHPKRAVAAYVATAVLSLALVIPVVSCTEALVTPLHNEATTTSTGRPANIADTPREVTPSLDEAKWVLWARYDADNIRIWNYGGPQDESPRRDAALKLLFAALYARVPTIQDRYLARVNQGERVFGTARLTIPIGIDGSVQDAGVYPVDFDDERFAEEIEETIESWKPLELAGLGPFRIEFDFEFGRVPRELNMSQANRLQNESESGSEVAGRILEIYDRVVDMKGASLAISSPPEDPKTVWLDLVDYEPVSFSTVRFPNFNGLSSRWSRKSELNAFQMMLTSGSTGLLAWAAEAEKTTGTTIAMVTLDEKGSVESARIVQNDLNDNEIEDKFLSMLLELEYNHDVYEKQTAILMRLNEFLVERDLPIETTIPEFEKYLGDVANQTFLIAVHRYDWMSGYHHDFPVDGGLSSYGRYYNNMRSVVRTGVYIQIL